MSGITVTVRNLGGDFRKTTEVDLDMRLGDFRQAAQELAGKSGVISHLILEKNNKPVNEDDTFANAGIESGTVFILISEDQGG